MTDRQGHGWRFFRAGGFDQARISAAGDYANLGELDKKLWAALACPVKGLEFDERTLALIDTDGDGRVRAPEVVAAAEWCRDHLRDPAALAAGSDTVPLASISDARDSGKALLASARRILNDLGREGANAISLADVSDTAALFAKTRFNGDGIVPAESAEDDATRAALADILKCRGALPDRSGLPGVDQAGADAFFAECAALVAWTAEPETDAAILPLGDATAAAAGAWRAARAKVDDWFARTKIAAFDARSRDALNRAAEEYAALAQSELSLGVGELAGFPLAHVEPGRALPLSEGLNPAWAGAVHALRDAAVVPLLGARDALTEAEWRDVGARLAAFEAWQAKKPATSVEQLGAPRVAELAAGGAHAAITALVERDKALAAEFDGIVQVERLVRYHRDLHRLLCNFVNFGDFYSRDRLATFQAGRLYLDSRACDLVVRVADAGKHAALAGMAKAYLAYCDCTRPSGERMQIAAAFTDGDSDYLMVGRNGVFFDRQGRDWDATITKVIENPISIRQAFWAPYKKLVRMIEELVAKRAAAADAESDKKMAAAAAATANADKSAAPPAAEPKKIDVGTVAAMGVAVGAIGAFLTALVGYVTDTFKLEFWQICLVFVGLLLVISGPSMLIAWLKLRQRNLGPILDANGWAVNGRVKMNVRFGKSLTHVAALPYGSSAADDDPFGEKPSAWPKLLAALVIAGFLFSLLDHFALVHTGLEALGVKDPPAFLTSPAELDAAAAKEAAAKADAENATGPTDGSGTK